MKSILVLCEGNICRSPMAQALLATRLPNKNVVSAGLGALVGSPADPVAVKLLKERGLDISRHRGTQVTRQLCESADMVFVMDHDQRRAVQDIYPHCHGRVFRIGEYIGKDVPDPFKKPEHAFRSALSYIDDGIREWLLRINRL